MGKSLSEKKGELLLLLCEGDNGKFIPMLTAQAQSGGIETSALAKITGCASKTVTDFLRSLNKRVSGAVEFERKGTKNVWSGTDLMRWLKEFATEHEDQTPLQLQNSFAEQKRGIV